MAGAFGAHAENADITTSQYYVDTKLNEKQDAAPANNANSVMTYDSTSADGVGAKAIYNASSTYRTQKNALVTAGTANTAIQNAANSEFTCANPPKCNLWKITSVIPSKNLLNPANIHQGTLSGGQPILTPSRCYFDYIPVHTGDVVNFTARNNTPPIRGVLDIHSAPTDDAFIKHIAGTQITPDANHTGYQFNITQDGYIRGLWLSNDYDFTPDDIVDPMVEISPTPSPYEPYQQTYLPENH